MNQNHWNSLRRFLILFPLAIWIGGGVALGFFAAPVAFADLPSRTLAGNTMATILFRFEWVLYVTLVCLIASEAIRYGAMTSERQKKGFWITVSIFLFLAIQLFSLFVVDDAIENLRRQIPSFDLPYDQDPNPLRKDFGIWHSISVICMLAGVALGSVILLLEFVFPAKKETV